MGTDRGEGITRARRRRDGVSRTGSKESGGADQAAMATTATRAARAMPAAEMTVLCEAEPATLDTPEAAATPRVEVMVGTPVSSTGPTMERVAARVRKDVRQVYAPAAPAAAAEPLATAFEVAFEGVFPLLATAWVVALNVPVILVRSNLALQAH